ncbi:hypothetical protein V865_006864 [Kwoniella europaea PYCC6329]|uniref:Uncharacterized protein n=1 Tax=Kwoniella europaea PYCC6329 TaxID=1423913 RepID=A0AAX4KQP5_9TREE
MNRPNRPPALHIDNRGNFEKPPLGMDIPELIVDPLPTPDISSARSEFENMSVEDWTNTPSQFPSYSGLPHSPKDTISRQPSEEILHDIISSTVPRGNVYIAGLPGSPKRSSPNHTVFIRRGEWSPYKGHVENLMPEALPSRPRSPNMKEPEEMYQPSIPPSSKKGRVLVTEDGQTFRESVHREFNIKQSRPNTASSSFEESSANEMSRLLDNPPDYLIVNKELYAYSPGANEYKRSGRVQSPAGSPTSTISTSSKDECFGAIRASSSRLSRPRSFRQGDDSSLYRLSYAADSTQSLAGVLAQADSPGQQREGRGLGLKIDTSGADYRASFTSYTDTIPRSPSSPMEGSSKSSPSVRRMYSSAGRIGSIETLQEDNESEVDDQPRNRDMNPSGAGSGYGSMAYTAEGAQSSTADEKKRKAFGRFWWDKVKSSLRSKRMRSGTPSPALSPSTGQTLSPLEYGYEKKYVQVPYMKPEDISNMSEDERKEFRRRSTLSIRSQTSLSGAGAEPKGISGYDSRSFQSRMSGRRSDYYPEQSIDGSEPSSRSNTLRRQYSTMSTKSTRLFE